MCSHYEMGNEDFVKNILNSGNYEDYFTLLLFAIHLLDAGMYGKKAIQNLLLKLLEKTL